MLGYIALSAAALLRPGAAVPGRCVIVALGLVLGTLFTIDARAIFKVHSIDIHVFYIRAPKGAVFAPAK